MIKKYAIFIILILLPHCSRHPFGPPHHRMPKKFTYQQLAKTTEPMTEWWKQFNDATLNSLIEQAVTYNYDLRIAIERIEEARAFYNIKKAELFPQGDIAGHVTHSEFSKKAQQYLALEGKSLDFFQLGFDAFWELDIWGKIWHEKNARAFAFQAQIDQMRDVYIILLADVARTYIELCSLAAKYDLLHQKLCVDQKLAQLQQDRFTAGLSSKIEVTIQEQAVAASADQIKAIQSGLGQTKNFLATLLGINPEDFTDINIPTAVPLADHELATGIPSDLLRRRPDIRQAERQLAAAHERVEQAVAEFFPSFSLLGNVFTESSKGSDWFKSGSISWSIGPSIRWPIINFGRIRSQVNVQKSKKRQATLRYSQTIITALQEVENFLIAYFTNNEQRILLEQKRASAQHEQSLTREKYVSGLANQLDELQTEKNRLLVALELTDIQQALSSNVVSLYKALGGGW